MVERTEGFCEDNWGRIDLVFSLSNEVDDFLIIVLSFRENHQSIDSHGKDLSFRYPSCTQLDNWQAKSLTAFSFMACLISVAGIFDNCLCDL